MGVALGPNSMLECHTDICFYMYVDMCIPTSEDFDKKNWLDVTAQESCMGVKNAFFVRVGE